MKHASIISFILCTNRSIRMQKEGSPHKEWVCKHIPYDSSIKKLKEEIVGCFLGD